MNSSSPIISRTSIFIFSYFLVNSGLSWNIPPVLALNWILLGLTGFATYAGLEFASRRQRVALHG